MNCATDLSYSGRIGNGEVTLGVDGAGEFDAELAALVGREDFLGGRGWKGGRGKGSIHR